MYLAQHRIKGKNQFFIKESYRDGPLVRSRKLFCLGPDPSRYIIYPGGNAFYIDESVTDALEECGVEDFTEELEDVFWPFLKPNIRRILEPYRQRSSHRISKGDDQKDDVAKQVHSFDKRRACYLKCGRVNRRVLTKLPEALLKRLREKSRDEIEQRFIMEECCLRPTELKEYIYATLDLQRFFPESFARENPEWLDEGQIEKFFLKEICRLHDDGTFWAGETTERGSDKKLNIYLQRYVIMFFDNDFYRWNPMEAYVRDFMNRHRFRHNPPDRATVTIEKASVIFGVKKETLRTMTKRGLTRYYRRLAKQLHPDKGGSQEKFVELTHAYEALLKRRK